MVIFRYLIYLYIKIDMPSEFFGGEHCRLILFFTKSYIALLYGCNTCTKNMASATRTHSTFIVKKKNINSKTIWVDQI